VFLLYLLSEASCLEDDGPPFFVPLSKFTEGEVDLIVFKLGDPQLAWSVERRYVCHDTCTSRTSESASLLKMQLSA
jgi:hypothetical protein